MNPLFEEIVAAASSCAPHVLDRSLVVFEIDCLLSYAERRFAEDLELHPFYTLLATERIDDRMPEVGPYLYALRADAFASRGDCYAFLKSFACDINTVAFLSVSEMWRVDRVLPNEKAAREFVRNLGNFAHDPSRRECLMLTCHSMMLPVTRVAFRSDILREHGKPPKLDEWQVMESATEGALFEILPTATVN